MIVQTKLLHTKKIKRPLLYSFNFQHTINTNALHTYLYNTWHTIWFDQYKAVYCKLVKPMDHRQAHRWHWVDTCTLYIHQYRYHNMDIQRIYRKYTVFSHNILTVLYNKLGQNKERSRSPYHGDHDHVSHNQYSPSCACFRVNSIIQMLGFADLAFHSFFRSISPVSISLNSLSTPSPEAAEVS